MVIVAGYLLVAAEQRAAYLASAKPVIEAARAADGCLDFSLSADLVDPARRRNRSGSGMSGTGPTVVSVNSLAATTPGGDVT